MKSDRNKQLIRGYLEGLLTNDELDKLLELRDQDAQFRSELELALFLHEKEKTDLRKMLSEEPKRSRTSWVFIAAALLILFTFSWLSFYQSELDQQVERYVSEDPSFPEVLLDVDPEIFAWKTAVNLYQKEDYKGFSAQMESAFDEDSLDSQQLLFYGISELKLNHAAHSEQLFKKLGERKDEYFQESRWYLALALLKGGNQQASAGLLKEIKNQQGYRAEEAMELLRLLDK